MYQQRFEDAGLAPEALSRTLEDAGGHLGLGALEHMRGDAGERLGVATVAYLPFCFFNWLSPIITISSRSSIGVAPPRVRAGRAQRSRLRTREI